MLHQQFLTWGMSDKVNAIVPATNTPGSGTTR